MILIMKKVFFSSSSLSELKIGGPRGETEISQKFGWLPWLCLFTRGLVVVVRPRRVQIGGIGQVHAFVSLAPIMWRRLMS